MLALREEPVAPEPAGHDLPLPGPDSSGDELFKMGLLYSTGQGGARERLGIGPDPPWGAAAQLLDDEGDGGGG